MVMLQAERWCERKGWCLFVEALLDCLDLIAVEVGK